MVRTQIQLTEQQAALLKTLSKMQNESVAAIIRRAVDQFLLTRQPDRQALYRQASAVAGKYEAGEADISVEHDRHLNEIYSS